jgi:methionyl-tRNA formyltransferase
MLKQERVSVFPDEDFGSLHDRLSRLGSRLLVEVLDAFESGNPPAQMPQDESQTTKAPKLFAADRVIDWTQPSRDIANRIRALSPSPGALAAAGEYRLKVLKSEMHAENLAIAKGEILIRSNQFFVGTADGVLLLIKVQPEGKRPMTVEEYLRGRPRLPTKFVSHIQE